jgi:transcriptional regulator with XRE-family HTH domain
MGQGLEAYMKGFGERLRKIRTEQNLTVKQLSALSGVPEKTIYRVETGEVSDPRVSSVVPIIKALNCSADEVIFDPEDFPQFAKLRQVFLKYGDLEGHQQDLLVEVIKKITLGMSMEAHISAAMTKGEQRKAE